MKKGIKTLSKLCFYKDFEKREVCFSGAKSKIELINGSHYKVLKEKNCMETPNH